MKRGEWPARCGLYSHLDSSAFSGEISFNDDNIPLWLLSHQDCNYRRCENKAWQTCWQGLKKWGCRPRIMRGNWWRTVWLCSARLSQRPFPRSWGRSGKPRAMSMRQRSCNSSKRRERITIEPPAAARRNEWRRHYSASSWTQTCSWRGSCPNHPRRRELWIF